MIVGCGGGPGARVARAVGHSPRADDDWGGCFWLVCSPCGGDDDGDSGWDSGTRSHWVCVEVSRAERSCRTSF